MVHLDLGERRHTRVDAALDPRRRGCRRPGRAPVGRPGGGGHGRPRHEARHRRLRRSRTTRPSPGARGPDGGHRRRTRRDGGGELRRLRGTARRRDARQGAVGARRGAVLPPVGRRVGADRLRGARALARGRHLAKRADLVLRPRAAERLRLARGEVLRQRGPGGRPAGPLRCRRRLPPGRGGHGPGDLRRGHPELLLLARRAHPDGAGRPGTLDRAAAGLAAAERAGPRPPDGLAHRAGRVGHRGAGGARAARGEVSGRRPPGKAGAGGGRGKVSRPRRPRPPAPGSRSSSCPAST
ncbi:putative Kynureninase [Actinacidiphila bryophytorum]|uniref:Kynureninase n=1 Tax=Actinacidiphila bryophytorum TaxID=1436133 RepID=A0A9W4ECX3_9ACTN|nr:putative Kynureninase [Actinacidiphila bryophytorum]